MRRLLLLTLLAVGPLGAQPLRAVLLQQASGDGHRKTLYALQEAGFQVTWINKDTAAGLPVTSDGWRAAWDVVFFGTLALEGGLDKVLSAEQLAAMIGFVRAGGGLVTVIGEAGKALAELLPVTAGGGAGPMEFRPEVVAPEHPALRGLPAQWPVLGSRWNSFAKVAAKPEATVLLNVPAHYAGAAYPFLVAGGYGAGRVICFNSLWSYSTGLRFANWEWAPAVFGQLGRWAAGREPLPADQVQPIADPTWFWRYEIETIPDAAQHLQQPKLHDAGPPLTETVALTLAPTPPAEIVPVTAAARLSDTAQAVEIAFGNGLVAVLDKRGMVAYRTADGLVLAREPTAQTPRILFSGAVTPEKVKTEGGEAFVLQEPIPAASAGAQTFSFRGCQADGPAAVATFGVRVGADEVASLTWRFEPRTQLVDGVRWQGVGESFVIDSPKLFVEYLEPSHRWAIGGQVAGHHTFRTGCYSQPRGYHEVHFDDATSQDAGHLRLFSSGQPFQMLGSPRGTLWSWPERPMLVASWLANTAGKGHVDLVTKIGLGRRRGRVEVPPMWYLFTPEPLTHNLWLSGYDHLRAKVRADYGLQHQAPKPTGMMRFSTMGFVDLRRYADALIPLAARLGFRRIDAGVTYVHDRMDPHNGGVEALKYLCDKARAAGIEVGLYAGSAWSKDDFEPLKAHPEWLVHDRAGKVQDTGYEHIQTVSLRSGWRDLTLQRYRELREQTGVGAVWLDSWTMPNEYLDFADPDARPTVEEAIRYVRAIQDLGYTTWIEGQSPAAIDSFWHRRDRYADFTGHEFVLANTSPFAYAGNGLFHLDLFRLTSYHAAMFQDPRLLTDPDAPLTRAAVAANTLMNQAHDTLGTPRHVRETPFGTVWECPTGYALFAHRTASVAIDLPVGAWDLIPAYGEPKLTLKGTKLTGRMPARSAVLVRSR